jgi:DNA-directed RNA polymerase specialized sigma24 family protein
MRALWREAPPSSTTGPGPAASEGEGVPYAAVARLETPLRDALAAVDVAGLSYPEAARVLRTSQAQVAARLFRGREELARSLGLG